MGDSETIPIPDLSEIPLPDSTNEPPSCSDTPTSNLTTTNTHGKSSRKKRKNKRKSFNPIDQEEADLMAKVMGFSSFDTTKGKMVPGNQSIGAVHVVKKIRYRQYMNRKGGFNRPLDKVA